MNKRNYCCIAHFYSSSNSDETQSEDGNASLESQTAGGSTDSRVSFDTGQSHEKTKAKYSYAITKFILASEIHRNLPRSSCASGRRGILRRLRRDNQQDSGS
uniref:AlNc14C11G1398 protein n=1 Tax=Albugo laibachii Nc14 TaxID=890382 RepID=F0W319_9STRA|nr:AlNc14C11G1398 [Albugo laibachii Nc14]|eukprot:CCA15456.1 AlNc14C11G1398 [Albugo laibachii Nc14]